MEARAKLEIRDWRSQRGMAGRWRKGRIEKEEG
jgi:hypothetical protein